MDEKDTVIVVGVTEQDEYGNLWVTPKGGGDKVKIAKKREGLHHLFTQGVAVMLHWEIYMNKPYVSDAKLVEGELPPSKEPGELLPEHKDEINRAMTPQPPAPQAVGMTTKELGDMIRAKQLIPIFGLEIGAELVKWYRSQILGTTRIPFDGTKLPKIKTEGKEEP